MKLKMQNLLNREIPYIQYKYVTSLGEALFLIAFFFFTFNSWFGLTGYQSFINFSLGELKKICYGIALLSLCAKALLQHYKIKDLLAIGLLGALLFISSRYSASKTLIWIFLFTTTAQGISLIPVSFVMLLVLTIIGILTFGGYAGGYISDSILTAIGSRGIRHSIGFTHPNTLAIYIFMACLVCLVLKRWTVRWFDASVCVILALFMYRVTGSRTSLICFSIILFFIFYLLIVRPNLTDTASDKVEKVTKISITILTYIIFVFSAVALFFYNPRYKFWKIADSLSSGRFHLMHGYFKQFGLTPFGNTFTTAPTQSYSLHGEPIRFVVDNLFARLLLQYGVATGLVIIIGVLYCEWVLSKASMSIFIPFSLFLVIGLMEALCLWFHVDYFILAISAVLYSRNPEYLNATDSLLNRVWLYRLLTGSPYKPHGLHNPRNNSPSCPNHMNPHVVRRSFHPAHATKNQFSQE